MREWAAEAPIFERLAAETVGTTMGLPVYRFPAVRSLRTLWRLRAYRAHPDYRRDTPRYQTPREPIAGYWVDEHHPDL